MGFALHDEVNGFVDGHESLFYTGGGENADLWEDINNVVSK